MAQILQIFLLCYTAINLLTAELQISCGEDQPSIFIEGVSVPTCYCNGIQDNMTTFDWTIVHETGRSEHLATCYGQNNCTTFATFDLNAMMFSGSSSLQFNNLTIGLVGILMCTETTSTFHGSANFTMKVTRVGIADLQAPKVISFLEGSTSGSLNCQHSTYAPNTLTWTIITNSGQSLQAGNCNSSDNYKCTSLLGPSIAVAGGWTYSYIYFYQGSLNRNMSAVVCTVSFPNSIDADNCTLDIYSSATMENCSITVHQQNWSFIFSCDISNAFSSQGQYELKVYETFNLVLNGQLREIDGTAFDDYRSYQHFLTQYINSANNAVYYRGRLVYSWPVSPYPGTYRSFKVQTVHQATAQLTLEKGLNVSYPIRPMHNCSDVTTPCSCRTETLGYPPGRLRWLIENTTVAIGDYGVKQLLFPFDNLTGEQDVTVATCELDWIQILVAKEPAILRRDRDDTREDKFKILTIAGWSLLGVAVFLNVIVVAILIHLGHLVGWSCKHSTEDDEVEIQD